MITVRSFLRGISAWRFAREERGVAAVEFSLILPIMITLWIGGLEVTNALSVDRRVNAFASSMGDLVARSKTISYAQIEDIFDLSEAAMFPYQDSGMSMRITAIDIDDAGDAKVAWSRARGTGMPVYTKTTNVNTSVPIALRGVVNEGTQLIMAETEKDYRPAIGYLIVKSLGEITLDGRMFFVPRLTNQVKICPTNVASCVATI
jgi:Flp pilus assembly protein TadG